MKLRRTLQCALLSLIALQAIFTNVANSQSSDTNTLEYFYQGCEKWWQAVLDPLNCVFLTAEEIHLKLSKKHRKERRKYDEHYQKAVTYQSMADAYLHLHNKYKQNNEERAAYYKDEHRRHQKIARAFGQSSIYIVLGNIAATQMWAEIAYETSKTFVSFGAKIVPPAAPYFDFLFWATDTAISGSEKGGGVDNYLKAGSEELAKFAITKLLSKGVLDSGGTNTIANLVGNHDLYDDIVLRESLIKILGSSSYVREIMVWEGFSAIQEVAAEALAQSVADEMLKELSNTPINDQTDFTSDIAEKIDYSGVTIITHGFQAGIGDLGVSSVEEVCWPLKMGIAISNRHKEKTPVVIVGGKSALPKNGVVRIAHNKVRIKPNWSFDQSGYKCDPKTIQQINNDTHRLVKSSSRNKNVIIVFDWALNADTLAEGYSEAAGDALSAYLLAGAKQNMWSLEKLHFIGHSRGTVVNSEAIQRLIYLAGENLLPQSVELDHDIHMTTLDPHPAGNWRQDRVDEWKKKGIRLDLMKDNYVNYLPKEVLCGDRSLTSIFPEEKKRCGVIGWKYSNKYKVSLIDNYYRTESENGRRGWIIGLNKYEGLSQNAPSNIELPECGHSGTWGFYLKTILPLGNEGEDCKLTKQIEKLGYNHVNTQSASDEISADLSSLIDVREDMVFDFSKSTEKQNFLYNGDFSKKDFDNPVKDVNGTVVWGMFGGYRNKKILHKGAATLSKDNITLGHSLTYIPHFKASLRFDLQLHKGLNPFNKGNKPKLEIHLIPAQKTAINSGGVGLHDIQGVLSNKTMVGEPIDLDLYTGDDLFRIVSLPKKYWGGSYFLYFKLDTTRKNKLTLENIRITGTPLDNDESSDTERPDSPYENELAIVLDQSGSMSEQSLDTGKTKIEKAKESLTAIVAEGVEGSGVSLSTFSDGGAPIQSMVSKDEFQSLQQDILDKIQPTGATNIGAGLEMGYQELDKTASNVQKAASLLSDGQNNRGEYETVVEKFKTKRWSIYTTAFGADADEATLKQIAYDTNALPQMANINNLTSAQYANVNHRQQRTEIATISDLLPPDGQLTYPFQVADNANDIKIQTSWLGSQLRAQLTSPGGTQFTNAEVTQVKGQYTEGDTFQSITIPEPAAGNWSLHIDWSEPPGVTEQVNINITEKTDLAVSVFGFKPSYSLNEPVNILIDIDDVSSGKRVAIHGATIDAVIQKPEEKIIEILNAKTSRWEVYDEVERDISRSIKLFDDGQHGDNREGDGIYGGYFQKTDLNGPYIVTLDVSGEKTDGSKFSQQTTASFQVGDIKNNVITTSRWLSIKQKAGTSDLLKSEIFNEPLNTIDDLMDGHSDSLDSLLD